MEEKKTPQADLDQQRTTGFLLGLVLVLAMLFVALEWNSVESAGDESTLDLDELVHEDEMIPMSIEEQVAQLEPDKSQPKEAEQLRIVDDNVELAPQEADAFAVNTVLRGHEFHYWDSTDCGDACLAWKPLSKQKTYSCMVKRKGTFAGFPHLYYAGAEIFFYHLFLNSTENENR